MKYHLGDILSITTGHLVSPRHIDGVYDILNYMTGDNLYTHQLPRGSRECKLELLKQYPQLAGVDTSTMTPSSSKVNWKRWLDEQVTRFGEYLEVIPLPNWTKSQEAQLEQAKLAVADLKAENARLKEVILAHYRAMLDTNLLPKGGI